MKSQSSRFVSICICVCAMLLSFSASAQTFVRYAVPSDFGSKKLFSDKVLGSVVLPHGLSSVDDNPQIQAAAEELKLILDNDDVKLLRVYVCGSASPDGLWQDDVYLSKARTDAAATYLRAMTGIPEDMIMAKSLDEDWDRLYDMIYASDVPFKDTILTILTTKTWSERKRALMNLDEGRVWQMLLEDFFPKMRCVRIAFFCEWDSSKPYLVHPDPISLDEKPKHEPDNIMEGLAEAPSVPLEQVLPQVSPVRHKKGRRVYETPWMMGFKTNLIGDAVAVPTVGVELQIGQRVSVDIQGYHSNYNIFNSEDHGSMLYGISPEIRIWAPGYTMRRGHFFGFHARCAWYDVMWKDGFRYKNASEQIPAYSAGFTYGYSLGFGRKGHWGLEFVLGVGGASYSQDVCAFGGGNWAVIETEHNRHYGITRAGINLTYRFSFRKVNPAFYDAD